MQWSLFYNGPHKTGHFVDGRVVVHSLQGRTNSNITWSFVIDQNCGLQGGNLCCAHFIWSAEKFHYPCVLTLYMYTSSKKTVPNWTHETKEPVPKTFPIRAHPCWQKISLKKKVANWTNTRLLHYFHHWCDLSRYQVCKHISNYQSWWICYWEWTDFCTENWALAEMLQWSIHHGSSMPSFGGVEHCHTY